jgi:hypothetical protein
MGEWRGVYRIFVVKPDGKIPLGKRRDGRITLRWVFRKWDVGVWTELIWTG